MKLKDILPEDLKLPSKTLIKEFKKRKFEVTEMVAVDKENPYKIHLLCKKGYEKFIIEIRLKCELQTYFEKFLLGCHTRRLNVKIYFAIPEKIDDVDTVITPAQILALKNNGIGLIVITENGFREEIKTISCNNRYVLEEGSSLGKHSKKIQEIIERYNSSDCFHAIGDLTIEVEEGTDLIALKATNKALLNISQADLLNLNWENKIDLLSTSNYRGNVQNKYFSANFSRDIKSFKDTRNLSHHPRTNLEKQKLERQYLEKMMQGIRLLRELVKIRNSIK